MGYLHRDRRVVEKDVLDRHQAGLGIAADEQRPLAGAVHEKVTRQPLARVEHEGLDVPVLPMLDLLHITRDVADAQP